MERKYWVPALERAHLVLQAIAAQPSQLRLMELSALTGINKSTMFSLLQTMESLGWVIREKGDTYALGTVFGYLGYAYFSGISLVELFMQRAAPVVERVGETLQLARLDGGQLIYLAKKEAVAPVRLQSEPGQRVPAYATALGKMLLAMLPEEEVRRLYGEGALDTPTERTLKDTDSLLQELERIRRLGYAVEEGEIVPGFACAAAAVISQAGEVLGAVSFSMTYAQWQLKREQVITEVSEFARTLGQAL